MDDTVLSLLSHPDTPLHNGGNVVLEYLEPHLTTLDQVASYLPQT